MQIFKTRYFQRWARYIGVEDIQLKKAIHEIEQGLHDGDLGSHLFKKRIALSGRGKRGGARAIVAYWKDKKAFLIYGYTKNDQANITPQEVQAYRKLAQSYFSYGDGIIQKLIQEQELTEIN